MTEMLSSGVVEDLGTTAFNAPLNPSFTGLEFLIDLMLLSCRREGVNDKMYA